MHSCMGHIACWPYPGVDNSDMRIPFTKMQGAGNDFVVLDETAQRFDLSPAQYRFLADRHFGVGADQILSVRPSPAPGIDFEYIIHNADGQEVEQCGNGARCFARFVQDAGLSQSPRLRVQTRAGVIEPVLSQDGGVTVNMGAPVFDLGRVPFEPGSRTARAHGGWQLWPLRLDGVGASQQVDAAILSMGNPHAVLLVDDVDGADVVGLGAQIESHRSFPRRVNVGFLQVLRRDQVRLRVFERGVGETLACGSGACAAVVAGVRLGLLDGSVEVQTRGGILRIDWAGGDAPVMMTGPATTVFVGTIDLPEGL